MFLLFLIHRFALRVWSCTQIEHFGETSGITYSARKLRSFDCYSEMYEVTAE